MYDEQFEWNFVVIIFFTRLFFTDLIQFPAIEFVEKKSISAFQYYRVVLAIKLIFSLYNSV